MTEPMIMDNLTLGDVMGQIHNSELRKSVIDWARLTDPTCALIRTLTNIDGEYSQTQKLEMLVVALLCDKISLTYLMVSMHQNMGQYIELPKKE